MAVRKTRPKVATRDELLEILTRQAREGSVSAAKTLLDEQRRDGTQVAETAFEALDGDGNVTPFRRPA